LPGCEVVRDPEPVEHRGESDITHSEEGPDDFSSPVGPSLCEDAHKKRLNGAERNA
jgi:hypothetical protein